MPPEDQQYDAPAPKTVPDTGEMPWLHVAVAAVVLASVAILMGASLVQFLKERPVNLRVVSTELAGVLATALEDQFIPPEAIRQSAPELRNDASGSIYYHRFEVRVPPQLDVDGLVDTLRQTMRAYYADTETAPKDGFGPGVVLSIGGRPFARVALLLSTAVDEAEPTDLRASCHRIARDVKRLFEETGVDPANVVEQNVEQFRDETSRWALTSFKVALPKEGSITELAELVKDRMAWRDVETGTRSGPGSAKTLLIAYAGKECVRVVCGAAPHDKSAPEAVAKTEAGADLAAVMEIALPSLEELPLDSADHESPAEPATPEPVYPVSPVTVDGITPAPPGPRGADASARPRVAIILDDGGYGGDITSQVLELDTKLTLSVLPNTPHAGEIAQQAAEKGFEVMLHMPMETHSKSERPFPGQLNLDMNAADVALLTRDALAQIPGAKGVNNHTGSRFTSDARMMRLFLNVIQEDDLFFVDSLTRSTSKAYAVALGMGLPTAVRDVFLDNVADPAAIRVQLAQLFDQAKAKGAAIGIGHFRANTVSVLAEELPKLAEYGVELVHVSELLQ